LFIKLIRLALKGVLNMGWRDFSPEKQTGAFEAFESFETGGVKTETFETLRVLPIKAVLENNNNNIPDFSNFKFSALPLKRLKTLKRGQEPELRLAWENPFPMGSREARAESLRVVAEAVADSAKNPGTIRAQGTGKAHGY
jgi:hypothetical protein